MSPKETPIPKISSENTSVGHNNDTSLKSYTLTLVTAKFKGFGTKSNCQPIVMLKCPCTLTDAIELTFRGTVGNKR